MGNPVVDAHIELALRHHEQGDAAAAELQYRRALAHDPDHVEALHGAAVVALQAGDAATAVARLAHCIECGVDAAGTHFLLGRARMATGDVDGAVAAYRAALDRAGDFADAHVSLGIALRRLGDLPGARRHFGRAVELAPASFEGWVGAGNVELQLGDAATALEHYRMAERLRPDAAELHYNVGRALRAVGRDDEADDTLRAAIERLQRAVALDPHLLEAWLNLGNALRAARLHAHAADAYTRLLEGLRSGKGRPTTVAARERLQRDARAGLAAARLGEFSYDEAWELLEPAIESGDASLAELEQALVVLPYRAVSQRAVVEFYCQYARVAPRAASPPRLPRAPGQPPLRVGLVSGDLRDHSVAFFLEPLLQHHDRAAIELTCYATSPTRDATSERLRRGISRWRDADALDDRALARCIADDGIDVLLDVAGRTTGNRLGLFGLRPAPLQASYLGYPTYSGSEALDGRLTDAVIDPHDDEYPWERPWRLQGSLYCYRPPEDAPDVVAPTGHDEVCFGSFNQVQKIGPSTVQLWARVLDAVPGSRLLLKAFGLGNPACVERLRAAFAAAGIDPARIECRAGEATRADHLRAYGAVDVALDTLPYNGATTTCEALWMGVPVVTLAGETQAARMGASILGAAGLGEFVATSADGYVASAVQLVRDTARRRELRQTLRARLRAAPLLDGPRYAHDFARTLHLAWQAACGRPFTSIAPRELNT
jgi:predicted O-linked N-acetylglucosamine transferase (SPINDLY family)